MHLAELLALYMQSGLTRRADRQRRLESLEDFSHQLDPEQLSRSDTPLPDPGELVSRSESTPGE